MKESKFTTLLVAVILLTTMLTACIEASQVTISGAVKATPSTISNGEEIELRVKETFFAMNSVNVDNPIKSVSYFIDGEYIAESRDKDNEYSLTYTIQGLSSGTHTVSARYEASSNNCDIKGGVTDCQITVK